MINHEELSRILDTAHIVDEAHATGGDLRRICDFFGVTMGTAEHYALSLNHPGLTDTPQDGDVTGSRTEDRS